MAETGKKYYGELNIFRAFIIIWVVIGHSFDTGDDFLGILHAYAYSFHMKAFIVLSGLLFAKKVLGIKSFKECPVIIKNRFLKLMVPYFFYTAVSLVLKLFLDRYANNKLTTTVVLKSLIGMENPNGGLWFLYALFVLNVLAVLLYKMPVWVGFIITAGLYIFHVKTGLIGDMPIVCYITYYSVYFWLGMLIYKYYDTLSTSFKEYTEKHIILTGTVSILYLPVAFLLSVFFVNNVPNANASLAYPLIVLLNIFTYYNLSVVIDSLDGVKKPFNVIGDYGMDIYLIGYYVMITLRVVLKSMLGMPYTVYSLAMCICGLLLPIPISKYIVRRFRITRALALGDFSKKEDKANGEKA